jgi:PKD repeat protein
LKKSKLIALSIVAVIGIGVVSAVAAYQEYFFEFTGTTHGWGCHGGGSESVGGYLLLTKNVSGSLYPNQKFELRLQIRNFTEAVAAPYGSRVIIGMPGEIYDNHLFSAASLANQTFNRREQLNASAAYSNFNYGTGLYTDSDNLFILRAPATAGTFKLGAVAIAAYNGSAPSNSADYLAVFVMDYINVTVINDLMPSAAFSANRSVVVEGGYVSLTHVSSNGDSPATYQWDFGDLTANATTENTTHQYNVSGVYTVTLTVVDVDGDKAVEKKIGCIIVVDGATYALLPDASFIADKASIQVAGTVTFTHVGSNGNPSNATYQWNFGDSSANATTENATHVYSVAGTYTVTLTIVDGNGDKDIEKKLFYITVVTPTADTPAAIPGYETPLVVAAIGLGLVTVALFAMKKKRQVVT